MSWYTNILSLGDTRSDAQIEAEIHEEIEVHLALCAEQAQQSGMDPDAARREAERLFGDPQTTYSACRKLQLGDRIMMRRIHGGLTGLLLIAVVFLVFQSRAQVAEAKNMEEWARSEMSALMVERQDQRYAEASRTEPVEYKVEIGQQVELRDASNRDLCVIEEVMPDGMVLLPEIGWYKALGKTRPEIEEELRKLYSAYYDRLILFVKVIR